MTSRFERLSVIQQILIIGSLAVLPNILLPHLALADTTNQTRLVFEINNFKIPTISEINGMNSNTPDEVVVPEIDPDIAILQEYLTNKGSPLAPYAEYILKHENWKLVLAISNGESTLCKHQMYNNCWGVGGAWNLRRYASFQDAITDVDHLLAEKYVAMGKDTPVKIVRKYVGSYSPTWVLAVNQTLAQLNSLPLQN